MRNKIWIDPDYAEDFATFEELKSWLESRKNDRMAHYYFGADETFAGELYTISDIKATMEESWFDEDCCPVDIWVFDKEAVRRESLRVSQERYREKKRTMK